MNYQESIDECNRIINECREMLSKGVTVKMRKKLEAEIGRQERSKALNEDYMRRDAGTSKNEEFKKFGLSDWIGISWNFRNQKWAINKNSKHVQYARTLEEAIAAMRRWNEENGVHPDTGSVPLKYSSANTTGIAGSALTDLTGHVDPATPPSPRYRPRPKYCDPVVPGVYPYESKRRGVRFRVQMKDAYGKQWYVGTYDTAKEANAAAIAAKQKVEREKYKHITNKMSALPKEYQDLFVKYFTELLEQGHNESSAMSLAKMKVEAKIRHNQQEKPS